MPLLTLNKRGDPPVPDSELRGADMALIRYLGEAINAEITFAQATF